VQHRLQHCPEGSFFAARRRHRWRRALVKSGDVSTAHGDSNHHIARGLDAHEKWLAPWVATGRAPRLVAGDRTAKILVTEFLAGELVLGSRAQECLETFQQAGELLA
jgi:hypothetical protein